MQNMHQPKPWTLKLKAKANNLKLKAKRLFPRCKFSMFRMKVFKKKAVVIKLKSETPVSVHKSKSLKYKIFKILKKLRIKRSKNKDIGAETNARSECLSYRSIQENVRGQSAHGLPPRTELNRVIINRQCIGENYVTEKMIVGLIIMSHYFLMLNNYVGSIKLNSLLIFITSMAMSYFTITFVRSLDQIEDFISGLFRRACSCYMLL